MYTCKNRLSNTMKVVVPLIVVAVLISITALIFVIKLILNFNFGYSANVMKKHLKSCYGVDFVFVEKLELTDEDKANGMVNCSVFYPEDNTELVFSMPTYSGWMPWFPIPDITCDATAFERAYREYVNLKHPEISFDEDDIYHIPHLDVTNYTIDQAADLIYEYLKDNYNMERHYNDYSEDTFDHWTISIFVEQEGQSEKIKYKINSNRQQVYDTLCEKNLCN